jgi:hypothetical protein
MERKIGALTLPGAQKRAHADNFEGNDGSTAEDLGSS